MTRPEFNNLVEQDHRRVRRLVRLELGFGGFHTAQRTLAGYEVMAMVRKGQLWEIDRRNMRVQATFITKLFQVAAWCACYSGYLKPDTKFAAQPQPVLVPLAHQTF